LEEQWRLARLPEMRRAIGDFLTAHPAEGTAVFLELRCSSPDGPIQVFPAESADFSAAATLLPFDGRWDIAHCTLHIGNRRWAFFLPLNPPVPGDHQSSGGCTGD
jgi:hypothetical protein